MPPTLARSEEILDLAERYIRSVGYNGFSFRDVASDAGIKSASVHYHFPTKDELAAAVAQRYAARFFSLLGKPSDPASTPSKKMLLFVDLFRSALRDDGRMCLFCVLGAEFATLPKVVQQQVSIFYLQSAEWLTDLLKQFPKNKKSERKDCEAAARTIIACLEGAMIVARASGDLALFDSVVGQLVSRGLVPLENA